MFALVDNDIIWKLYLCNVFDEALALYGSSRTDVRVLESVKYVLGNRANSRSKPRKSLVELLGDEGAKKFGDLLESLPVASSPTGATDDLFVGVQIDAGEAHLLRVAYENPSAIFATGDKRCLHLLLETPACAAVRASVTGRVACFESILLELIERHGFEWVRARVAPVHQKEGTLRLVFSGGIGATRANVIEGLQSHSRKLVTLFRAQSQSLFEPSDSRKRLLAT